MSWKKKQNEKERGDLGHGGGGSRKRKEERQSIQNNCMLRGNVAREGQRGEGREEERANGLEDNLYRGYIFWAIIYLFYKFSNSFFSQKKKFLSLFRVYLLPFSPHETSFSLERKNKKQT